METSVTTLELSMTSEIAKTHDWFVTAGQMPATPAPDVRQVAFYIGMQLEEMAEKLEALGMARLASGLSAHADLFKRGANDDAVRGALLAGKAEALLDADMDLLWVTIGAAYAQGADAQGAYAEVAEANWAKFPNGVVTRHPETGKVLKPEGWQAPNLTQYLHPSFTATKAEQQ